MTETTKEKTPSTTPPLVSPRSSFLTPEMIKNNPVLEVAGLFVGDPLWQELRDEIERNRERDQQSKKKQPQTTCHVLTYLSDLTRLAKVLV